MADVQFAIIGVDFLRQHRLLVDPAANRLVGPADSRDIPTVSAVSPAPPTAAPTPAPRPAVPPGSSSPSRSTQWNGPSPLAATCGTQAVTCGTQAATCGTLAATCGTQAEVQAVLEEFADVVNTSKVLPSTSHGVEHFLRTTGPPIASPFQRLDAEKLASAKAEFLDLEKQGIVRRSSSPWASPLHMVKKADGSWRPCGD